MVIKMRDMLTIIIRIILAIAAIFVIIIVFAVGTNSSEDKRKMKLEQERMVEYTVKNIENIKKIEFKNVQKNVLTGHWKVDAIINDDIIVSYSIDSLGKKADIGIIKNEGGDLVRKKIKIRSFKARVLRWFIVSDNEYKSISEKVYDITNKTNEIFSDEKEYNVLYKESNSINGMKVVVVGSVDSNEKVEIF